MFYEPNYLFREPKMFFGHIKVLGGLHVAHGMVVAPACFKVGVSNTRPANNRVNKDFKKIFVYLAYFLNISAFD